MQDRTGGTNDGEYNQVQNMVYVLEGLFTMGSMGVLGGVVSKHKLEEKGESSL